MLTVETLRTIVEAPAAIGLTYGSEADPDRAALRATDPAARAAIEFRRGREAASEALSIIGVAPDPIPAGPRGEPVWPDGVVGSITHTGNVAIAVCARRSDRAAIGIDIEKWDRVLSARVEQRVCTPTEIVWLSKCVDESLTPLVLFCAKEATYKALDRFAPGAIGWHDIEFRPGSGGRLAGELSASVGAVTPVSTVEARFVIAEGFVVACVEVHARAVTNPVPSPREGTDHAVPDSR